MKVAPMVGVGLAAWVATSMASAGTLRVQSSGVTRTIECKGRSVQIDGSSNDITLLGDCPSVVVNGTGQDVKVERAGSIRVAGVGNTVVWGEALEGNRPRVRSAGINNSVRQGTVGSERAMKAEGEREEEEAPPSHQGGSQVTMGGMSVQAGATDAGESIAISRNGLTKTITCDHAEVDVSGNMNTISVRGECDKVVVSGNHNVLKIETVAAISTPGNFNDVVWEEGVGDRQPRISNIGTKNSIRQLER
jgi:hypothetical protein